MGAVSVFMVGNYLNQPFRDLLCFAWCCCFLLCVYSSNELVEIFFEFFWIQSDVRFQLGLIWRQSVVEMSNLVQKPTNLAWIGVALLCWGTGELLHAPDDGCCVFNSLSPCWIAQRWWAEGVGFRVWWCKKLYRVNEWRHHRQYFRYSRRIFISSYNEFWVLSASG